MIQPMARSCIALHSIGAVHIVQQLPQTGSAALHPLALSGLVYILVSFLGLGQLFQIMYVSYFPVLPGTFLVLWRSEANTWSRAVGLLARPSSYRILWPLSGQSELRV